MACSIPYPGSPRGTACPLCRTHLGRCCRQGELLGSPGSPAARVPDPSAAGRGCGAPAYQVVDLVVPPTGHKHHLAFLLRDLQRRATAISRGVQAAVQEAGGGHVVG